jgi:methylthioxylose transferase
VFLSYGLVLFGVVVLLAAVLTVRRRGLRRTATPWLVTTAGVVVVATVHLSLGFNWVIGLARLRVRYYQGVASARPFSYFVYADLAAWLVSCSPLLAVGLWRSIRAVAGPGRATSTTDRTTALLALSGLVAVAMADASALSKAETERIWLAFGLVASAGLALLRDRAARWALVASAGSGVLVNHLLDTGW